MKLPHLSGCLPSNNPLSSEWRKSFNFAIGLHILVTAFTLITPFLFDRRPELPEIYTVNLFTATEVAVQQPAAKAPARKTAPKPPVKEIEPAEPKVSTASKSIAEEKLVAPIEKVDIKPISLRPVKKKIKIGRTKEEAVKEKARLSKAFERIQARAEEKEAKKEAGRAAIEAVNKLADSLKTSSTTDGASKAQPATTTKARPGVSGLASTGSVEVDLVTKHYTSAIFQHIHNHYILPTNMADMDESLVAIVRVTIQKNGEISNSFLEGKSSNIYFNQFVLKAVSEASPLPPLPEKLKKESLVIGLRFKAGEMF